MLPDKPLHTFISYSRVNQQFAIKLTCELKSAGFSVWMDQFDIPTGARWDDEIEKALRTCQVFMFIMTPDSIASENAKDEVGYAIDHGKRIMPVLLEECEIPLRLRRFQHVDFTHKSFNEGIDSAKELLSQLIHEIETSTSNTANAPGGAAHENNSAEILNEPKTAPSKKQTPSNQFQPRPRQPGRLVPRFGTVGIGVIMVGLLTIATLILKPLLFTAPSPSSPTPTTAPAQTQVPADTLESTDTPTTPAAASLRSFTEDFNSNSQWNMDWTLQFRHGNAKKQNSFIYAIADGDLVLDLTYEYVWGYFLYDPAVTYDNVEVEVVVSGLRSTHTLGLICQFSDQGWYEFDINGSGFYDVRYVDTMESSHDEEKFMIGHDYSPAFKDSYATARENTIRAGCDRNNLSLFVNDAELMNGIPGGFKLGQGQVGIAVRSFENYPIHVVVKSVTVSEP